MRPRARQPRLAGLARPGAARHPGRRRRPPGCRAGLARAAVGLLAAAVVVAASGPVAAQLAITTPAPSGDQLLFFYDARADRVPFLNVSNPATEAVTIALDFYDEHLDSALVTEFRSLAGGGNVVIDPTALAQGKLAGHYGLAVVTPVVTPETPSPVVPPQPLLGSFTLANTMLAAAFGENALGRLAVTLEGDRAPAGSIVTGAAVRYQKVVPGTLRIPLYFDPQSLAPAALDGNRVILIAFDDAYGPTFAPRFAVQPFVGSVTMEVRQNPTADVFEEHDILFDGVALSDLQTLVGANPLTSSGTVSLHAPGVSANLLGLFAQSLGTFSSGHRMPGAPELPDPRSVACESQVTATLSLDYDDPDLLLQRFMLTLDFDTVPTESTLLSLLSPTDRIEWVNTPADWTVTASLVNRGGSGRPDRLMIERHVDDQGPFPSNPYRLGELLHIRFDCLPGAPRVSRHSFTCSVAAAPYREPVIPGIDCLIALNAQ